MGNGFSSAQDVDIFLPVWMFSVYCDGDEERFMDCRHAGPDIYGNYCSPYDERVGVRCWKDDPVNMAEDTVRLVDTSGTSSPDTETVTGRLEVYVNDEWGTVCVSSFGWNEAHVACRNLGFSGGTLLASALW